MKKASKHGANCRINEDWGPLYVTQAGESQGRWVMPDGTILEQVQADRFSGATHLPSPPIPPKRPKRPEED